MANLLIDLITWQLIAACLHIASLLLTILGFGLITIWIRRLDRKYNELRQLSGREDQKS